MTTSQTGNKFWLNRGERGEFKLINLGYIKSEKGISYRELSVPKFLHISSKPFYGFNRKTVACNGNDCELCAKNLKPSKVFTVHIVMSGKEMIYDMPTSAMIAISDKIKKMENEGKTESEILNTIFVLERLEPSQRPWFTCGIIQGDNIISEELTRLTDEDIEVLKRLNDALKEKKYANPRGAMINTLQRKYEWNEAKIKEAFDKYLDDYGFLRSATKAEEGVEGE